MTWKVYLVTEILGANVSKNIFLSTYFMKEVYITFIPIHTERILKFPGTET